MVTEISVSGLFLRTLRFGFDGKSIGKHPVNKSFITVEFTKRVLVSEEINITLMAKPL